MRSEERKHIGEAEELKLREALVVAVGKQREYFHFTLSKEPKKKEKKKKPIKRKNKGKKSNAKQRKKKQAKLEKRKKKKEN